MEKHYGKINFNYPILKSIRHYVNGSVLLVLATLLALVIANSPLADAYNHFWETPIALQIGNFNLFNHGGHTLSLLDFINDALMVVFFFMVGLEIKREMLVGELSSIRKAMLPVIAAIGGMIIPVVIFYSFMVGTPGERGMAIPMATDIAFSLGVLMAFSKRVPLSLKVFLTTFAVADDIGGIIVIALFYSSHLDISYLVASFAILCLMLLANWLEIRRKWVYGLGAFILWYLFMQSGIHATIAGVIAAFTVPATPEHKLGRYITRIKNYIDYISKDLSQGQILSQKHLNVLKSIESYSDNVISPLQSLEDNLHGFVNYIILPLFAFANAGVTIIGGGDSTFTLLTFSIMTALVIGKFLGIYLATYASVKLKITPMPNGMTWKNLTGISMLGGIGFTVSLFIATLSFGDQPDLLQQAKLGILLGSIISAIIGYILLSRTLPKEKTTN